MCEGRFERGWLKKSALRPSVHALHIGSVPERFTRGPLAVCGGRARREEEKGGLQVQVVEEGGNASADVATSLEHFT